jgi:hypothetical protein
MTKRSKKIIPGYPELLAHLNQKKPASLVPLTTGTLPVVQCSTPVDIHIPKAKRMGEVDFGQRVSIAATDAVGMDYLLPMPKHSRMPLAVNLIAVGCLLAFAGFVLVLVF